jgi:hypothetical protein
VDKILARNIVVRFFGIYNVIGQNSSKMPITLDRRPMGTSPFEVFHTSLGSTLCTESELKSDLSVASVLSLDPVSASRTAYQGVKIVRDFHKTVA